MCRVVFVWLRIRPGNHLRTPSLMFVGELFKLATRQRTAHRGTAQHELGRAPVPSVGSRASVVTMYRWLPVVIGILVAAAVITYTVAHAYSTRDPQREEILKGAQVCAAFSCASFSLRHHSPMCPPPPPRPLDLAVSRAGDGWRRFKGRGAVFVVGFGLGLSRTELGEPRRSHISTLQSDVGVTSGATKRRNVWKLEGGDLSD